jgi:hypothetical protein
MSTDTLPEWLRAWAAAEVAAGRARHVDEVVLSGDVLSRAHAWLEEQAYDGVDIAPEDRIDGRRFMTQLSAMVAEGGDADET